MSEKFPPPNYIQVPSNIPGIDVYAPAPEETGPQQEILDFRCPQCGGNTAFSVADGGLTCANCGYHQPPAKAVVGTRAAEFEFTPESLQLAERGWGDDRKDLACQNCGARTSVPAQALTHTCPFCGSNKVIQQASSPDELRPRFLVPFKIEAKACQEITRTWLGSSWLTPGELKSMSSLAGFTGIYLPFWTFDSVTRASWRAEVGHTVTESYYEKGERKTRTKTVWRWESGQVQLNIDDLLVQGTTRVSQVLLDKIKGYDLKELCPYEPQYLVGFQAQAYDVPLEPAWETARQEMREQTRQACVKQASTSRIRNFSMNLDFSEESWRYILLPVYLATYRFENQTYQVMINGQTGTISGQRPVAWTKVWLAIAALLAPGLILGILGLFTILLGGAGIVVGGIGFALLIIGLVISIVIFRKAQAMDDV